MVSSSSSWVRGCGCHGIGDVREGPANNTLVPERQNGKKKKVTLTLTLNVGFLIKKKKKEKKKEKRIELYIFFTIALNNKI